MADDKDDITGKLEKSINNFTKELNKTAKKYRIDQDKFARDEKIAREKRVKDQLYNEQLESKYNRERIENMRKENMFYSQWQRDMSTIRGSVKKNFIDSINQLNGFHSTFKSFRKSQNRLYEEMEKEAKQHGLMAPRRSALLTGATTALESLGFVADKTLDVIKKSYNVFYDIAESGYKVPDALNQLGRSLLHSTVDIDGFAKIMKENAVSLAITGSDGTVTLSRLMGNLRRNSSFLTQMGISLESATDYLNDYLTMQKTLGYGNLTQTSDKDVENYIKTIATYAAAMGRSPKQISSSVTAQMRDQAVVYKQNDIRNQQGEPAARQYKDDLVTLLSSIQTAYSGELGEALSEYAKDVAVYGAARSDKGREGLQKITVTAPEIGQYITAQANYLRENNKLGSNQDDMIKNLITMAQEWKKDNRSSSALAMAQVFGEFGKGLIESGQLDLQKVKDISDAKNSEMAVFQQIDRLISDVRNKFFGSVFAIMSKSNLTNLFIKLAETVGKLVDMYLPKFINFLDDLAYGDTDKILSKISSSVIDAGSKILGSIISQAFSDVLTNAIPLILSALGAAIGGLVAGPAGAAVGGAVGGGIGTAYLIGKSSISKEPYKRHDEYGPPMPPERIALPAPTPAAQQRSKSIMFLENTKEQQQYLNGTNKDYYNDILNDKSISPTKRALAAMEYIINNHGVTPEAAAGIVSNMMSESTMNPYAVGDNGAALGYFQHQNKKSNGFRRDDIWKNTGVTMGVSPPTDQIDAAIDEAQRKFPQTAQTFTSKNPYENGSTFTSDFERPANKAESHIRGMQADKLYNLYIKQNELAAEANSLMRDMNNKLDRISRDTKKNAPIA